MKMIDSTYKCIQREVEHNTEMLVRSTVAQPDVHNKCAGMLLKKCLKSCSWCTLCVCCAVLWCVVVRFGAFVGSLLSTVLSRFNEDSVVTYF